MDRHEVGWHYEQARLRIDVLTRSLGIGAWEGAVPACPGWRVRDVVAHLVGITEDAAAGRLSGIPTEAQVAEQLARHHDDDPRELLDSWALAGPFVAEAVTASDAWPAAIDVVTHEHDIRGALGVGGARDHPTVIELAHLLAAGVVADRPIRFELEAGRVDAGSVADSRAAPLRLRTTSFELLRLRLGRRSVDQVLGMAWDDDPRPVLPSLFVFGPAEPDVIE